MDGMRKMKMEELFWSGMARLRKGVDEVGDNDHGKLASCRRSITFKPKHLKPAVH